MGQLQLLELLFVGVALPTPTIQKCLEAHGGFLAARGADRRSTGKVDETVVSWRKAHILQKRTVVGRLSWAYW